MYKFLVFCSFTLLTTFSFYAQIEVPKGKYPFNKVIEWPQHGSVLLSNDPSGSTTDLYVSFLNHEGAAAWAKAIYPSSKSPKLILSAHSDYLYFIDNFKPEKNFIKYNQINRSGNVVSTKFDMLKVIRSHGYRTPDDLELKEIVNTSKALVFYFQLPIKKEGIIENFFVTVTHHNNRMYHYKGPVTDTDLLKKGVQGPILFAEKNNSITTFSYRTNKKDATLINFFSFDEKANPKEDREYQLKIPAIEAYTSKMQPLALNGSSYFSDKEAAEAIGKGVSFNDKYYYLYNDADKNCLKIVGLSQRKMIEPLNKCKSSDSPSRRPNSSITYFEMDKELYIFSKIDDHFMSYKIGKKGIEELNLQKDELENVRLNPSAFIIKNKDDQFVHLMNGTPYFIHPSNLEDQEEIIFRK